MKAAIVTIYGEFNFGNRLQNYAVQKYLENNGLLAETIVPCRKMSALQKIKSSAKNAVKKILYFTIKKYPYQAREAKFKKFTRRYIKTKYIKTAGGELPKKLADSYDVFVVGSDQVWNPTFGGYEKIFNDMFLRFVPDEKKMCFSPSIGISEIPGEWKARFKEGLMSFPKLSVRENRGAEIIRELTGRDAEVLVDPTLTLTIDEWNEVSAPPLYKEGYVFEYFLGKADEGAEDMISSFAKLKKLKRVNVLDREDAAYVSGPAEFISLIKNAEAVFTDSFHACVFSIIYDVPFKIFSRKDETRDMYSRINTLLTMFGIENITDDEMIVIDKATKEKVLRDGRDKVDKFFGSIFKEVN